jgi:hypothetical protein
MASILDPGPSGRSCAAGGGRLGRLAGGSRWGRMGSDAWGGILLLFVGYFRWVIRLIRHPTPRSTLPLGALVLFLGV